MRLSRREKAGKMLKNTMNFVVLSLIFAFLLSCCSKKKTRQERESNGIISSVSDIVSVAQPSAHL